jgi:hypothetical protein
VAAAAVFAFASLAVMTIPAFPLELDPDFAWNRVLNFAHERGWQFGSDLVFTYGPAGFLISPDFAPHAFGARLVCEVAVCVAVTAGVCLVARGLGVVRGPVLTGLFVWLLPNLHPRADLLLYIGLICWTLLCLTGCPRRLAFHGTVLAMLVAFCTLAKISLLIMGSLCLGVVCFDLVLQGRRRAAVLILSGSAISFLLGWIACGQRLLNIAGFLRYGLILARDYDQTMGLEGLPTLNTYGLLALGPALVTVLIRSVSAWESNTKHIAWRRIAVGVWGLGLMLLSWKHGFVMTDLYHAGFFFGLIPVLAVAIQALPGGSARTKWCAWISASLACLVVVSALNSLLFPSIGSALAVPLLAVVSNGKALLHPDEYRSGMMRTEARLRDVNTLPRLSRTILHATVDVFGLEPYVVLFNDWNYHPRPVFQSYSAYSRRLMRINEQFFLSDHAPEFVLFNFEPVERRFPPLEDALALRAVLMNYELIDADGPFLLLKAKTKIPAHLIPLREGTVRLGTPIDIRDFGGDELWLQIDLQPSLLGRVRRFLFRTPIVRLGLQVEGEGVAPLRFQAPVPMLAAGFIANPVLIRREDVVNYFQGRAPKLGLAYSVQVNPSQGIFWRDPMHYWLYRIEKEGERR